VKISCLQLNNFAFDAEPGMTSQTIVPRRGQRRLPPMKTSRVPAADAMHDGRSAELGTDHTRRTCSLTETGSGLSLTSRIDKGRHASWPVCPPRRMLTSRTSTIGDDVRLPFRRRQNQPTGELPVCHNRKTVRSPTKPRFPHINRGIDDDVVEGDNSISGLSIEPAVDRNDGEHCGYGDKRRLEHESPKEDRRAAINDSHAHNGLENALSSRCRSGVYRARWLAMVQREKSFEISPLGYDSRYDDIVNNGRLRLVVEQRSPEVTSDQAEVTSYVNAAIVKCERWLAQSTTGDGFCGTHARGRRKHSNWKQI